MYKKLKLKDGLPIYVIENDFIGNHIEKTKDYFEATDVLKHLKSLLKKNLIIYDMGANIGNHSLYFSRELKAKKIYSFEPVPMIFNCLQKNSSLVNNIKVFNVGLGQENSSLDLYTNNYNKGVNNYGGYGAHNTHNREGKVTVDIVNLDEFVENNKILPPDFIKMDIESHEIYALKGGIKTISKYKPTILIESFPGKYDAINNLLTELGYIEIMRLDNDNYIYTHPKKQCYSNKLKLWLCKLRKKLKLS